MSAPQDAVPKTGLPSGHTLGPRRPGHLYVLLAPATTEPEEQFIEVEDAWGHGVRVGEGRREPYRCADGREGEYRLLDFPDPAVHDALLEALDLLLVWHDEVRREFSGQTTQIPSSFGIEKALAALQSARGEEVQHG